MEAEIVDTSPSTINKCLNNMSESRDRLLTSESVTKRKVTDIKLSPNTSQVLSEINLDDASNLFVGANRSETHKTKLTKQKNESSWVTEAHDGRNVRREFGKTILFPRITNIDDQDNITVSLTETVPFKGIDAKGGGITLAFMSTRRGRGLFDVPRGGYCKVKIRYSCSKIVMSGGEATIIKEDWENTDCWQDYQPEVLE